MNPILLEQVARIESEARFDELKKSYESHLNGPWKVSTWQRVAWRCGEWMIRIGRSLQSMTKAIEPKLEESDSKAL